MKRVFWAAGLILLATSTAQAIERGKPVHGLAMYGAPKHGPDFAHFDHVNPDAPKGGALRLGARGTFDSLNPFIVKGVPAGGLNNLGNASYFYFVEALMARAADEPSTTYCLICETTELAPDNSWQDFTIRPEARFHDGSPVTADDIVFSFNVLMEKGNPQYKFYWGDVDRVEKLSERKVRFIFKTTDNKELPTIMGELPVLSKAFWSKREFDATTLDVPISTGSYKISRLEPGRFIVYTRDPNYWGRDLAINRGAYNFDEIRIDYYRDEDVSFEAFKAFEFDLWAENSSARWSTGYDKTLVALGAMKMETFQDGQPDSAQAFVMNLRRDLFADVRVREALAYAFDFDWSNKTLSYGLFSPMNSYYGGSDLAAVDVPTGEELQILEAYRDKIPERVFTTPFTPPRTDGSGNNRNNLVKSRALLKDAGWDIKDGVLTNTRTGVRFEFEFLLAQQSLEKWINPYLQNLARLGIKGKIRLVDVTQYLNRLNDYDFDMVVGGPGQSISPGNEQRELWGSGAADRPGGRNWSGIKDPVVDAIVEDLIQAQTRESLAAHTRALDRVLLWNWYTIPQLNRGDTWLAYWSKFGRPERTPLQGPDITTWWFDPAQAATIDDKRARARDR